MAETWLPSTDGIVTRLLATFGELLEAGHQVLIICPRPQGGYAPDARTDPRVQVRTVPTLSVPFIYGGKPWGLPVPTVARHLRDFRPDVVHVVNPLFLGIAGVTAARCLGIPLVASYHTNVADYATFYHLGVLRPLIWFTLRMLHNQARLNLATSAMGEGELREHGVRTVRRWPRGVDLLRFHPAARPRPAGGRPVALYVGRLAAEKGLHRLQVLSAPASGFELVLVGEGPQSGGLHAMLGPTARFTGLLLGDALAESYRAADVFVFPSTTDTLGLVVLEALASGLPVVAVDTEASRELLGGCPAARLVPADDHHGLHRAAAELVEISRSEEGPKICESARRLAERCGWRDATTYLAGCYEQVVRANGPSRLTSPRDRP